VYGRVSLFNNIAQEYYNDFCMMTGATMINENIATEIGEDKLSIDDYIGEVAKISIGNSTTHIKGFYNRKIGIAL
jgi:hypothetical protein